MLFLISPKPQNEAKHLPLRSQSERLPTVSYHTARDCLQLHRFGLGSAGDENAGAGAVSHRAPAIKKDKRAFLNRHDAVQLITQQFFKYESAQFHVLEPFSGDDTYASCDLLVAVVGCSCCTVYHNIHIELWSSACFILLFFKQISKSSACNLDYKQKKLIFPL